MSNISLSESQQKAMHHKKIRSGRGWILALSIFQLLFGIILTALGYMAISSGEEGAEELLGTGIGLFAIGTVFLGCWFWAKRQPFPAALTALLIYITLQAADIALDTTVATKGYLFKILFLVGLSSAVSSAYKLKKSGYYP